MGFPLTVDQRLAVDNTGGPLLVSAAAGAGKTRVLVERLLDRVEKGADVDEFLIITFTNAAATELRQRIGEELAKRLAQRPGDRHLRRQVNLVYAAHISTIHAFCQEFLRAWGHLADLDPDFRLCDEGEGRVLLQEALEEVLERHYESPDEDFDLLMDMFSPGRDDGALGQMAVDIYQKLQSHPDPRKWLEEQGRAYDLAEVEDAAQTPWGEYLLGRIQALAGYWHRQLSAILEECETGVAAYCPSLAETVESLEALRRVQRWDDAALPVFPRLGSSAKCNDPDLARRAKNLRESCKKQFEKAGEPLELDSGTLLRDMREVAPAVKRLLALVGEMDDAYAAGKRRRGVVDFNDLEHMTLDILVRHPEVGEEVSARLVEVMVDEYQDTNQVQNAIFDRLTGERGNLFMVGDVKQSIYRFRLADPTIFLEKYHAYPNAAGAAEGQGRRVILGENFRSRREVIDCVNFLFENLMSASMGELDYGEEEALRPGGEKTAREDCAAEFHLIANPAAEEEEGDSAMAEPRFVAARLAELVASGFPVDDGQGGTRPVRPSDMAILLRAPNRVLSRYVRALYEAGLPWASEGGEDFLESPEAAVALSYLEIIDNPRQDVPLIAVLRSPLYGFTPDDLARLKAGKGEGCFYDALRGEDDPRWEAFLADLEELRLVSQDKKSYEILWDIYGRKGLLAIYPEERREGLLSLYAWARRFESSGHKGLFGFLTHLRRRREQGESLVTTTGGGEGVQILSIHRSKGLEYPVVAVVGLGKGFNHLDSREAMLFHRTLGLGPKGLDRERMIQYPTLSRWAVAEKLEEEMRGEELRLLYVALTRAKEKLIMVCTMKDPEREADKLLELAKLPPEPEGLRRLDSMGHWILAAALCRPEAGALRQGMGLRYTVPAEVEFGMRWRMELHSGEEYQLPPPVRGTAAEREEETVGQLPDYTWRYPHIAATALPSKLTATQLKGRELDQEAEEDAVRRRPAVFDRPDFAEEKGMTPGERGTAHHVVMQFLDFSQTASIEAIDGDIKRLVRKRIVTERQGEAVDRQVILNFFRSPLGREVLAAGDGLHREFKFSVLEQAGRYFPELPPDSGETVLLQGVVDCWFDSPEGLVIVDFKSDRVNEENVLERAEEYRPQLEAYAAALGLLLERPVARKVLWFFALSRAVEV